MPSDCKLLSRYADTGDETAFAEVVNRHTNLVYTAALRLTAGDAHLAQDVAQQVFTTLASKAAALSSHASLVGWLHTTTRYAASVARRGERRRQTREREASAMEYQPTTTEADWMQLEPLLDEAVGRLRANDREAVLLRYFQGKSHREVAAELGWSEGLARKRVERALEQMRAHFTRRGVTVSSVVLATSMTANSVQAAPVGLAPSLANASLAGATKTGVFGAFLKGISITSRAKIALAASLMVGLSTIPMVLLSNTLAHDDDQNDRLTQENASLQKEANQLNQKLRNLNPARTPAQIQAMGPGYLPVGLDALKNVSFSMTEAFFKLNSQAADLLGMTSIEKTQVQDILNKMQNRVQEYERANLRAMTSEEIQNNIYISDFLNNNPGTQSVYEIPAMSEEARLSLLNWLSDSLAEALGPERGAVLLSKAVGGSRSMADQLWLKPNFNPVIAFSDHVDASGTPKTSWIELNGPGGGGGSTNNYHPYPEDWAFLLKDRRGDLRPPEPVLTPQQTTVQNNLRKIMDAAAQYMLNNGATTITYQQLIEGPQPLLKPITPVAGENYSDLVIHITDTSISVVVPGQGTVKLTP